MEENITTIQQKQIDVIYKTCEKVWGLNLKSKSRQLNYIMARACFYEITLSKMKKVSLVCVGNKTNRTHATVINAIKQIPSLERKYDIFKTNRSKIIHMLGYEDNIDAEDNVFTYLGRKIDLLLNQNISLQKIIDNNNKIQKHISNLPEKAVIELIDNRIIPFVKMWQHKNDREAI